MSTSTVSKEFMAAVLALDEVRTRAEAEEALARCLLSAREPREFRLLLDRVQKPHDPSVLNLSALPELAGMIRLHLSCFLMDKVSEARKQGKDHRVTFWMEILDGALSGSTVSIMATRCLKNCQEHRKCLPEVAAIFDQVIGPAPQLKRATELFGGENS